MRHLVALAVVIVSCGIAASPVCADSSLSSTSQSAVTLPAEGNCSEESCSESDDSLLQLMEIEPELCCQVEAVNPKMFNTLAGLFLWRRLKILCPSLYPTAIC